MPRGKKPSFEDPLVLTAGRHGTTVEAACKQVHRSLLKNFDYAMVWGMSVRHTPQRVGMSHELADEDVIQIVKKRNENQARGGSVVDAVVALVSLCLRLLLCSGRLRPVQPEEGPCQPVAQSDQEIEEAAQVVIDPFAITHAPRPRLGIAP